jgi:hypothetical protein
VISFELTWKKGRKGYNRAQKGLLVDLEGEGKDERLVTSFVE